MLVGMTYKSITDTTNLDISKGSAKREILLCSQFTDVFVNGEKVENTQYVLLLKFRKWFKNGLKAQKLLAQGIALGIIATSKAPCKGKSLIYLLDF